MGYEFQKSIYDKCMEALMETYTGLLGETDSACDASDEDLESLAACILEYVAGELASVQE